MKEAIRAAVFCAVFFVLFFITGNVFRWKEDANTTWHTSATVEGFYHIKRNTIDVLFLGSSQCVSAFIPNALYSEYKIRSYNLGTPWQNPVQDYYLIKEALKETLI